MSSIRTAPATACLAVFAALAAAVSGACTTDAGGANQLAVGRSHLLGATTANVLRILTRDGVVVWLDSAANVYTCPSTGCDGGKATLLTSASNVYGGATYGQYSPSVVVPAAIAAGRVFWATGGELYSCPLAGCPAGPANVFSGTFEIVRIVSDGTTLAWATAASISLCAAADCQPRTAVSTCSRDEDCPGDVPVCSADRTCMACDKSLSKSSCSGVTPACGSDRTCVECDPESGRTTCTGPGKTSCDPVSRTCVACVTSADCGGPNASGPVCLSGACVKCDGDFGSGKAAACPQLAAFCDAKGSCAACDASCASPKTCTSQGCLNPCAQLTDCDSFHTCDQSLCVPKKPTGAACSRNIDCLAGACTGGVCGNAADAPCVRSTDCIAGVCAADKRCAAPDGAACSAAASCRTGVCMSGVCGLGASSYTSTSPATTTALVVGGRLYYSLFRQTSGMSTASIVSCAAAQCPANTTPLFTDASGSIPYLVGGDAQSLFFVDGGPGRFGSNQGGELYRCDLPGCTAAIDMGVAASNAEVGGDDVYVNLQDGNALRCTRETCGGSYNLASPEPTLASSETSYLPFGSQPFTADATATYWVTSSIFGTPGHLVVATPR